MNIRPHDSAMFSADRISAVRHDAHLHPLLQMPQLLALARELRPLGGCRFLEPGSTQASEFRHHPESPRGRSLDEVFARIEEPGSWIALYNIEQVQRYQALLDAAIDSMRAEIEREQPGIFLVTGFIFISSPPSVTPYHIDRENNLWLQVLGRKTISVWDRALTPAPAVEEFIVHRDLRAVRLTESLRASCREHHVAAGDGVYFPSTTPHATRTDSVGLAPADGVSISIGINFYTEVTRRHALAHQVNRLLRRAGIEPVPPGRSAWRDRMKAPLGRVALELLRRRRRGFVTPPGMR